MKIAVLDDSNICKYIADGYDSIDDISFKNFVKIPDEAVFAEYHNKRYINGIWENVENYESTEQELIQAEILLSQAEIIAKQNEHDEVLAEILLGQQEAKENV